MGQAGGCGGDGETGRQGDAGLGEMEAGARSDDEVAGEEQVGGAMPLADGEEGICAEDAEHCIG